MRVGSLFAGIGGFDLGFERAGMSTAWFCEQDEFCQRVLAKHWPGVPCYPDVTELRAVDVEPVDVLCGGFPCQDISLAGRGAGIEGSRSGLWGEFARIIRELEPRWVCVENVPALTARGLDRVLRDLAACGYDAEWDCLPASAFGAPHRRDRIWLIAYPGGERSLADARSIGAERWGVAGNLACAERAGQGDSKERQRDGYAALDCGADVAYPDRERPQGSGPAGSQAAGRRRPGNPSSESGPSASWWATEPDVGRVAHELSPGLDGGRGPVLGLSPESGRRTRNKADQEAEDLHDLRRDLHELQPLAGEDLLAAMSERGWPPERLEALGWWDIEPPIPRVGAGIPNRVDRLSALGNALVPQIAEWIGERIMSFEEEKDRG